MALSKGSNLRVCGTIHKLCCRTGAELLLNASGFWYISLYICISFSLSIYIYVYIEAYLFPVVFVLKSGRSHI